MDSLLQVFNTAITVSPFDALTGGRQLATCTPTNYSASPLAPGALWGWQGWYLIVDIFLLFVVLFFEIAPVEMALLASVLMLYAAGIVSAADAWQGFSNSGVLAITCLFVVAEALSSTGAIDYFMGKLLGQPKTLGQALTRMMLPAAFVAAWISSTAVLAVLIPVVLRWSKKINQPPSLLFMPLCYAIHLGGTVTLVGTTTNLVVSGLAASKLCRTMGIFELTTVGLPVAFAGIGFLLLFSPLVLPNQKEFDRRTSATVDAAELKRRRDRYRKHSYIGRFSSWFSRVVLRRNPVSNLADHEEDLDIVEGKGTAAKSTDYVFHALLPEGSEWHDKSVEAAGLRHLDGLFLVSVQRNQTLYSAVGPEFVLRSGDDVGFAGLPGKFLPLCKEKNLHPIVEGEVMGSDAENPLTHFTTKAIISAGSDLIGKTLREVNFRTRYNASALSIQRAGDAFHTGRIGQIPLKIGDTLVLIINENFDWNAPETKRDLKPFNELARKLSDDSISTAARSESGAVSTATTDSKDYVFSMRVPESARLTLIRPLGGLTIENAGLRNIPGVRPFAVTRNDVVERDVGPDFVLQSNDIVWFAGDRHGLSNLRRIPGLEDTLKDQVKKLQYAPQKRRLVEVVVSLNADILYKTVREIRFRSRYNAAIVAIQRRGQRLLAKIGDIEIEPGDVLVIDAGPDFVRTFRNDHNFLVVAEVEASTPPRLDRFYIAAIIATAMVVCTAATGMDLLLFAMFAVAFLLILGVITRDRAHKAVDWAIIITIASAFGLSAAITSTGVADVIGRAITNLAVLTGTGEIGVLAVVLIFTEILCALITAKAGATLMFPIAAVAASKLHIDQTRMLIALMLGSSDFTTPQGHQTNLMIYGPGAYHFIDYQKLGIPLEIFLNVIQLLCLYFYQSWYYTSLIALAFMLFCIWADQVLINRRSIKELAISFTLPRTLHGVPGCDSRRCCQRKADKAQDSNGKEKEYSSASPVYAEHQEDIASPDVMARV